MNSDLFIPIENYLGTFIRVTKLDFLLRNIQRSKIPILMYHSIYSNPTNNQSCLFQAGMSVHVKRFREHMEYISKKYNTVSLTDIVICHQKINNLPRKPCVITFDDGFLDVYHCAVPILRELGLRATIFPIGNTLQNHNPVWLYELYMIIDSTSNTNCTTLFRSTIEDFPFTGHATKSEIRSWARRYFVNLNQADQTRIIKSLKSHFKNNLNSIYFINKQHVRELMSSHIDIGSHSMQHEYLSNIETNLLEKDIADSTRLITEVTGKTPKVFCYPFGGIGSWDTRVVYTLKKHGYLCAVSSIEGLNSWNTDLFSLRRIRITSNIGLSAFVFRILGLRSWLWSLKIIFTHLIRTITNDFKKE